MTKQLFMKKNNITMRKTTIQDREQATTDYQRNADYIIGYSNGKEIYSKKGTLNDIKAGMNDNDIMISKLDQGDKIYCDSEQDAYKIQDELNKLNVETRVGCNELNTWSVYIISLPNNIINTKIENKLNT